MQVRMGVDNMVRMVKSTATPSVVQEMRKSYFLEAIQGGRIWKRYEDTEDNYNGNDDWTNSWQDEQIQEGSNPPHPRHVGTGESSRTWTSVGGDDDRNNLDYHVDEYGDHHDEDWNDDDN